MGAPLDIQAHSVSLRQPGRGRGYQFPSIKSREGYGVSKGSNTLHRGSILFIFEQYMFPGSTTTSQTLSLSRFQMERFHQLAPQTNPIQSLNKDVEHYLGMALIQSSMKTYSSGTRQFFTFCSQMNITPELPINEDTLIYLSVEMAHSVLNNSRLNYLSGIWHYLSSHGYELTLASFLRLQLIPRGIKRSQGVNSKMSKPISLQLLSLFYHLLTLQHTDNTNSIMLWRQWH